MATGKYRPAGTTTKNRQMLEVKLYLSAQRAMTLQRMAERHGLSVNAYCTEVIDAALADRS